MENIDQTKNNFTPSEILFVKANLFNWDDGLYQLHKMLQNEHCDRATALLIYWRCDPNFYYSYSNESEIPDWSLKGYKLLKEAEKTLTENKLPECINYTPDKDRIPKDSDILNKIPKELLLPSKGIIDAEVLTTQFIIADYLIDYCTKGKLESVKKMLETNPAVINLGIKDKNPLMAALSNGRIDIVAYLLEQGADIDATPLSKNNIPIICGIYYSKKAKLFELLVKYGADINAVNPVQDTVLHRQLDLEQDIWKKIYGPVLLKMMLKLGADINKKNAAEKTPLDLAKEHNNEEALAIIEKFMNDKAKKAKK